MKPGVLVTPNIDKNRSCLLLTPVDGDEIEDMSTWIEWNRGEIGMTLPNPDWTSSSLIILTPRGVGTCFWDELTILSFD